MTDRYHALTVILERETRSDDIEYYIQVISAIRGVAEVRLGEVNDWDSAVGIARARHDVGRLLVDVLSTSLGRGNNDDEAEFLSKLKALHGEFTRKRGY